MRRVLSFLGFSYVVQWFLNFTHKAERTPFQTHYFLENLVALVVEPGPLDL
jgi:hypothetical protein